MCKVNLLYVVAIQFCFSNTLITQYDELASFLHPVSVKIISHYTQNSAIMPFF